jgi:hypothetical protein
MTNQPLTTLNTILLILILSWMGYKTCNNKPHGVIGRSDTTISIVYVKDTNTYTGIIERTSSTQIIERTIPADVDTAAILAKYFAMNIYQRNYTDSLLRLDITDTVTMNQLGTTGIKYQILRPEEKTTITVTNTVPVPVKIPLFRPVVGVTINGSVVPEIGMQIRDRVQVRAGYDIMHGSGTFGASVVVGR